MAILDNSDQDLLQLWSLITELSEQLNQNRSLSVSLHAQAGSIKNQAVHSQTGFVFRRFNLDKPKDAYEGELERMNGAMTAENQALQHDNKQLNVMIKEYEQTLETLMSTFRNRAQDVQERELSLIREYETKLLAREEENATQDLASSTATSESLARISYLLRQCLRSLGGEDVEPPASYFNENENRPWTASSAAEYALDRDIELARLEKENEELKRMIGLVPPHPRRSNSETRAMFEAPRSAPQRIPCQNRLGGAAGTVGPFGTYKRTRPSG